MIHVKGCLAVAPAWDQELLRDADVLIGGNRIMAVGKNLQPPRPAASGSGPAVIDAAGMIAVPGFVNTHHHFFQTLTRNLPLVQNAPLFPWLKSLYEVWKHLDEEAVLVSSMVAMGELLKTGCTCSTDHHYLYPRSFGGDLTALQFQAADTLGMRFSPCRGSMSRGRKQGGLPPDSVVQDEEEILKDSQRVIETYHDPGELSMRRIALAPCSPFSVTKELMKETARLARERGVKLHTHLAETADEDAYCLKTYGKRPLALMEEIEFLGPEVSFAHGIHFQDEELRLLAESDSSVAHCPSSNMRLGSGIARVREMLDLKVNVALAVDGSASNDSSDFLGEMRQALLLQRVKYGAAGLTAREVLRMATENGTSLLGFSRVGRLEPGWAADLALFDLDRLEYSGSLSDPLASLVFSGINHQAAYTIVNGRIAVEKGKLSGLDEKELSSRANRASSRLLRAAGL